MATAVTSSKFLYIPEARPARRAAPRAVTSTMEGTMTSASQIYESKLRNCLLLVIPPSTQSYFYAPTISRISSTYMQIASQAALTRCDGRVCYVIPRIVPRASGRHRGAKRPLNAGINTTPPVSSTFYNNPSTSFA